MSVRWGAPQLTGLILMALLNEQPFKPCKVRNKFREADVRSR